MKSKMRKIMSMLLAVFFVLGLTQMATPKAYAAPGDECAIGETFYHTLSQALTSVQSEQTITLLKDIDYYSSITIVGKNITFALSGNTLNVIYGLGVGLEVTNGRVTLEGTGIFNVTGTTCGVKAGSNATVTVTNATASGPGSVGAYALDGGSITVTGNAQAADNSAIGTMAAGVGSSVIVGGNSTSTGVYGFGACSVNGGHIEITGNVTATGAYSTGADANAEAGKPGGSVIVNGDVQGVDYGVDAYNASSRVEVHGNVTTTGDNGRAAYAYDTGSVEIWGNVISNGFNGFGASSVYGSIIVKGNVIGGKYGVYAFGGTAYVMGNSTATAADGIGAHAKSDIHGTGEIIIDGEISAVNYIEVNNAIKAEDGKTTPTTKSGYYTYTDGTSTTVWVKEITAPPGNSILSDGSWAGTPRYVSFGQYPQNDVSGATTEPIIWRVLDVGNDEAFLLSDKVLDYGQWHASIPVPGPDYWNNSSLKARLNGSSFGTNTSYFTTAEQGTIVNDPNGKIFLLSESEARDTNYGFTSGYTADAGRQVGYTTYAIRGNSLLSDGTNTYSWLRTSNNGNFAYIVLYPGDLSTYDVRSNGVGIRPALKLDLSSYVFKTGAGTETVPYMLYKYLGNAIVGTAVNGNSLSLTLSMDVVGIDSNGVTGVNPAQLPAPADFTITVDGAPITVTSVDSINGADVTLTLASAVQAGQTVTLDYTLKDHAMMSTISHEVVDSFTNQAVTNTTADLNQVDSWTLRTAVGQYANTAIAYGNNVFVTVGEEGRILTSADGAGWMSRNSNTNTIFFGVAYGIDTFVAVGGAGTVRTSQDGATWTARSIGTTADINWVSYGNGTFVAVGTGGKILTSQDGEIWNTQNSGITDDLYGVSYGNGTFAAVGWNGTIITSANSTDWTVISTGASPVDANLRGVCYGDGAFVAVGDSGKIYVSQNNGIDWALKSSSTQYPLCGVTYGNGIFVAVGVHGTVLASTDGSTWITRNSGLSEIAKIAALSGPYEYSLYGVCSGNGSVIAVGAQNTIIQAGGTVPPTAAPTISPGGGTFTGSTTVDIAGSGGTVYYTTDGSDSTPYAAPFTLSQSATVKAAAFNINTGWSSVVNASFTLSVAPPPSGNSGGNSAHTQEQTANGNIMESLPLKLDKATGIAVVEIDSTSLSNAFDMSKTDEKGLKKVTIEIPTIDGATVYEPVLPASFLTSEDATKAIEIKTDIASVTLPGNMLSAVNAQTMSLTIAAGDKSRLAADVQAQIGSRPIVALNMKIDGQIVPWSNERAPVTVKVPYNPTAEELADPEHITVWYIDGSGKAVAVPNGRYDPDTGTVIFTTTHFSDFAVVYVHKTFDDLDSVAWAKNQIEVLVSKGIINGTSENTFSPAANITRADYLVLLVKTLGVTAEFDSNFDDVAQGTYYYEAIGIAKKLDIATGSGNNRFNPKESISRQDMMVLAARALEKLKVLKAAIDITVLDKFSDKGDIAGYAAERLATLVKEGLVTGSGDKLDPHAQSTRAEAAVFLYNIYNKY